MRASRQNIDRRVTKVADELCPTDIELKDLQMEMERESKFNPISSSLNIIKKAEEKGKRLQEPIDATIARYKALLARDQPAPVFFSQPAISPY